MASIGVLHQDDWGLCGVVLNDTTSSDKRPVTGRMMVNTFEMTLSRLKN